MQRLPASGSAPVLGTVAGVALVGATIGGLVPVRSDVTRATPALVLVLAVVAAGPRTAIRNAAMR